MATTMMRDHDHHAVTTAPARPAQSNGSVVVPFEDEDMLEPLDLNQLDEEAEDDLLMALNHPFEKEDDTTDDTTPIAMGALTTNNHDGTDVAAADNNSSINFEIDEETMMILSDAMQDDSLNDNRTTVSRSTTCSSNTPCGSLMNNPYADFNDTFFAASGAGGSERLSSGGNRNRLSSLDESSSSISGEGDDDDDDTTVTPSKQEPNDTLQWNVDGCKELEVVKHLQLSFDKDESEGRPGDADDDDEDDLRLLVKEEEATPTTTQLNHQSTPAAPSAATAVLPPMLAASSTASCPSKAMEDILAQELSKLTFEEKERAAFDVHGFCNGLQNTGIAIAEATSVEEELLVKLEKELVKLTKSNKQFKKDYKTHALLHDKQFRLMFLRCEENFDVKLAAKRIVNNLETKRKIFGEDTVGRHLRESDLTPQDIKVLESNFAFVAPQRDAAGRYVLLHVPDCRPGGVTMMDCFRAHFYLLSNLARDIQVQRQGIAVVALFTRIPNKSKREAMGGLKFMNRLKAGLARKITAAHLCVDTSKINPDRNHLRLIRMFVASAQLMMRQSVRDRFRSHVALRETIHFQMKTYGILLRDEDWPPPPPPSLTSTVSPVSPPPTLTPLSSGEVNASDASFHSSSAAGITAGTRGANDSVHNASCTSPTNSATSAAAAPASSSEPVSADGIVVMTPTDKDVLLGRGKHTRNHAGNINATNIVNAHRQEYSAAKKHEKTAIAERIVKIIQSQGGRFLIKQTTGGGDGWVPVDNQTARNKISHLYRNTKKSFLFGSSAKR